MITREEAKTKFSFLYENGFIKNDILTLIDRFYDGFEQHIKSLEAQLANAEQLSCDGYKTPEIVIMHEDCGGDILIDYQKGVRYYESYCEKCNADVFITVDFDIRIIHEAQLSTEPLTCEGCKCFTQYGCNVVALCKRHELFKTLPYNIQVNAIDRYSIK